jgi:hypothetical protein
MGLYPVPVFFAPATRTHGFPATGRQETALYFGAARRFPKGPVRGIMILYTALTEMAQEYPQDGGTK